MLDDAVVMRLASAPMHGEAPWPLLHATVTAEDGAQLAETLAARLAQDPALALMAAGPDMIRLGGRDEAHLVETLLALRREGVAFELVGELEVAFREVLGADATVDHTHAKLRPAEFARVRIAFARGVAGSGVQFFHASQGTLSEAFAQSVEQGIRNAATEGLIAGFPVVDVIAVLEGGAFHDLDSTPAAFEAAGRAAFANLRAVGAPSLIEPLMDLLVIAPSNYGDAIADDLAKRKASVRRKRIRDGEAVLTALARLSTVLGYAAVLQTMTGGQGTVSMTYEGYAHVPGPDDADPFDPAMAMRA